MYKVSSFADLSSFINFLDSFSPPLLRPLAMRRSLRRWGALPAVAPLKAASQTLYNTKEKSPKRPSTPLIPTPQSKQAVEPQARVIANLWTNRSCSAAWSTSSSFFPVSSLYTLSRGRRTKLRVTEVRRRTRGPQFQSAPSTAIVWTFAQTLG